ncbi:tetratricopeptide repeat protein [Fontivita pretiosa]|uniref:tetratricopeptide repeat protein n=1 Tax=Fontivita pretiosa TaxID=2989684 RepID=UPI003D17AF64
MSDASAKVAQPAPRAVIISSDADLPQAQQDRRPGWRDVLIGVAIIAALCLFIYWPALGGAFILDDDLLLTNNTLIRDPDGLIKFWTSTEQLDYWPMTYSTLWIEWRLWGMNPTGYHVTNLVLHIIESLLIWRLLNRLKIPGAFAGAAIFAVHPVNVESVAWIAQRKNVLAMLFLLLSIWWYLKAEESSPPPQQSPLYRGGRAWGWWVASLVVFTLGMLAKGSIAPLPLLLLGITWWRRQGQLSWWDLARTAPFFAVATILAMVNIWFQNYGADEVIREASFLQRLLGAGAVIWFYLYKALLPINLSFIYPLWNIRTDSLVWWLPLIAAVSVTTVLWMYRRSPWVRAVLFAWGFFCVSLIPVMGFTDVTYMRWSLVADHYQHIAIIGVIGLLAGAWGAWYDRAEDTAASFALLTAAGVIGVLSWIAWKTAANYQHPLKLYAVTVAQNPTSWAANNIFGGELVEAGEVDRAIPFFQQSLRLKPGYHKAHYNYGMALARKGRFNEAITQFQKAIDSYPQYVQAHNFLGRALTDVGRPQEAIPHFQRALEIQPGFYLAYVGWGKALLRMGQPHEAIEKFRAAMKQAPGDPQTHLALGETLNRMGQHAEAAQVLREAVNLRRGRDPMALAQLANALRGAGQLEEAIQHYRAALELDRKSPLAGQTSLGLGNALLESGRASEAIPHYQQALELRPDLLEARVRLSQAYAKLGRSADAVAAGQRALDLARATGRAEAVKEFEAWLTTYQANPAAPPPGPTTR